MNNVKKKPYQIYAWFSTILILTGAILASIVPENHWHHIFFILGNGFLAFISYLWREGSLLFLNLSLALIYVLGIL